MPIEVKQATQKAAAYLKDLFSGQSVSAIRLEEVEISDDSEYWFVTLSFTREDPSSFMTNRELRQFKLDASSGEVRSMTIRKA